MIIPSLRRLFRLPRQSCGSELESEWIAMGDGTHLATHHYWPIDVRGHAPSVLIRTPHGARSGLSWLGVAARLIAESGYHVIVQDVRGRYASEGEFVPFANERRDGADTMAWLVDQPWCEGAVGLFGASYLAYTAWCIAAETPSEVGAISTQIGSGDLYGLFYPGGAFALSVALEWSLGMGEHEAVPAHRIDLERGLEHLPVREADRVGLRTIDWYRDWVDHPQNDDYWQAMRAAIPETPPPALLIAGWYDFFLALQVSDFGALEEAAHEAGSAAPRLVIGPWSHGLSAKLAWWRHGIAGVALRETVAHFDRHLKESAKTRVEPAVRYFRAGDDAWLESEQWPPADTSSRSLHLRADGSLDWSPANETEGERSYRYDPASPTPTRGGALFGLKGGVKDQRNRVYRRDLLVYESSPMDAPLVLTGTVVLHLYLRSDAENLDLAAKLIDVHPNGRAENICDALLRRRLAEPPVDGGETRTTSPSPAQQWTVELGAVACVLRAGHSIRLELASANFPRLDRNPGVCAAPGMARRDDLRAAEQSVLHDPQHASHLVLPIAPA